MNLLRNIRKVLHTNRIRLRVRQFFAFCALFLLWIVNPLVKIRFGAVVDRTIGDFYLRYTSSQFILHQDCKDSQLRIIWFFLGPMPANFQANLNLQMSIKVFKSKFLNEIWTLANRFKLYSELVVPHLDLDRSIILPSGKPINSDFFVNLDCTPSYFPKTPNSTTEYLQLLENLGLSNSNKIICINIRNSAYKKFQIPTREKISNLKIDALVRAQEYRDSDFSVFESGCKTLYSLGFSLIYIGFSGDQVDLSNLSFIVDYPRSPFCNPKNDLLLLENCDYLISTITGAAEVTRTFKGKIVGLNIGGIDFMNQGYLSSITIPFVLPKVICDYSNNRPLNVEELRDSKILKMNHRQLNQILTTSREFRLTSCTSESISNSLDFFFQSEDSTIFDAQILEGKKKFQYVFDYQSKIEFAPCLSPFWANLNV